MAKRVIAVDLDGDDLHIATLQMVSGKIETQFEQHPVASAQDIHEILGERLVTKSSLADRVVTALDAQDALFRRLRFPFREKRKIEAALPLSFAAQLPISLDDQVLSFLPPRKTENEKKFEVDAVAVGHGRIEQVLAYFPDPLQNPGRIDLFPFALAPVLGDGPGILILCRSREIIVALLEEGRFTDYRFLPLVEGTSDDDLLDFILPQIQQLEQRCGYDSLPLWLLGSRASDRIQQELQKNGRLEQNPAVRMFAAEIPAAAAPVALLALAELQGKKGRGAFNFRQGEFAAKGQWEMLRPKLVVATILLLLICLGTGVNMYLHYQHKSAQHTELAQRMAQLFQQVMPAGSVVVDVPLQLENYRQQLQAQVRMFGLDGRGATAMLQELSATISEDVRVELQDLNYSQDEVRISGFTSSFDAVNQIAEMLADRPLFQSVNIANARLATDNTRVDFELQVTLTPGGQQ